jgi:hypothetical protein
MYNIELDEQLVNKAMIISGEKVNATQFMLHCIVLLKCKIVKKYLLIRGKAFGMVI